MRRTLLSVVVGFAGAAGVAASGWALQAAALPPPTPAARVVADASTWFHEYRLVVDVFHFDHERTSGACLRGWFGRTPATKVRGSLLSIRSGPVLRVAAHRRMRISVLVGRARRRLPARLASSAGCGGELASEIAAAAQAGGGLRVERAYAANQPAVALKVSRGKHEHLTLFVSPRTYRPLVAIVARGREQVTAGLYLRSATHRLLAKFNLLREVEQGQRR